MSHISNILGSLILYYILPRHVISTLPYIDRSRLGVMGTNYGASLASLVMGQSKLAMCGVLTSPVVNWRYHGERRDKRTPDYNLS